MSYSTIYNMQTAQVLADCIQSQAVCNETINTARDIAKTRGHSVIVEDRGIRKCYRVTPSGLIWRAPKSWLPCWYLDDDE